MRLRQLQPEELEALVEELRAMADLPAGADPANLERAREIRFLVRGQSDGSPAGEAMAAKADEAYRALEVLLHDRRWRDEPSLGSLRRQIKSACARIRHYSGLPPHERRAPERR